MEPQEKAKQLINKFLHIKVLKLSDYSVIEYPTAKECALITCNEMLDYMPVGRGYDFWLQVTEELDNL